jgi:hypothetical protein
MTSGKKRVGEEEFQQTSLQPQWTKSPSTLKKALKSGGLFTREELLKKGNSVKKLLNARRS